MKKAIVFITIITFLTHGLYLHKLGLYWDDLFFLWVGFAKGGQGLIDSLSMDRPASGVVFALGYWLAGLNLLSWHVLMLFFRWLVAIGWLWSLKLSRKFDFTFATLASALFVVYPGFTQQPLALAYINFWSALALWTWSLVFWLLYFYHQQKLPKYFFLIVSLILAFSSWLILEITLGLEPLRLLLTLDWDMITRIKSWLKFKKAVIFSFAKTWVWMLLGVIYLSWRFLLFNNTRADTEFSYTVDLVQSEPSDIWKIPLVIVKSINSLFFNAWWVVLADRMSKLSYVTLIISIGVGVIASVFSYYYFKKNRNILNSKKNWLPIFIGLAGGVFSLLPIFAGARSVVLLQPGMIGGNDRYVLMGSLAVSLLVLGTIQLIVKVKWRLAVFCSLLFLAVTAHLGNNFLYQRRWQQHQETFWQMWWRVPAFQPDTELIFDSATRGWYPSEYEIWATANFMYHFPSRQNGIHARLLDEYDIIPLTKQLSRPINIRGIEYQEYFKRTVVLIAPTDQTCLRLVTVQDMIFPTTASPLITIAKQYTHLEQIQFQAPSHQPPKAIFGDEPAHSWCFYYQKMNLANQQQAWRTTLDLAKQAEILHLEPKDKTEWWPILLALLHTRDESMFLAKYKALDTVSQASIQLQTCYYITRNNLGTHEVIKTLNCETN